MSENSRGSTMVDVGPGRHVPAWLVLSIVCIGQFMVVLDASIVNVALPSIQRDLHFSSSGLQWIVNAYT
jgi:MFS family permease